VLREVILFTFVLISSLQIIGRDELSECGIEVLGVMDVYTEVQYAVEGIAVVATFATCYAGT
jgi:hypothetical protein